MSVCRWNWRRSGQVSALSRRGREALESKDQFQYTRNIESGKETNRRRPEHTKRKQKGQVGGDLNFPRAGTKREQKVLVATRNGRDQQREE